MYSINLAKFTLDEFERILLKAQLLPSQRIILENLSENMLKLKNKGLSNLLELQKLLKKKDKYAWIAKDMGIAKDYLFVLNRMVNSYVVKAVSMEKLNIFSSEEIYSLANEKIKNSEHYYTSLISQERRENVSKKLGIPIEKMQYALHIIDLLRINGVGVEYAKILYNMGIRSVADYNKTPSNTILESYCELNKEKAHTKATLGISDIEYCRRFTEKLDCDVS